MVYKLINTAVMITACYFIHILIEDMEETKLAILDNTINIMQVDRVNDKLVQNQSIIIKRILQ